ncbi:hypothetical protein DB345_17360 [Spartobacteria bacterium LR76]|nr:hypothetical protein DB345_17360 [Spartobacteria bacterium LR76]
MKTFFFFLVMLCLALKVNASGPTYTWTNGTTVNGKAGWLPNGVSFSSGTVTINVSVTATPGSYYVVYESTLVQSGSTTVSQTFNNGTSFRTGTGGSFTVPAGGNYTYSFTTSWSAGAVSAGGGEKTSGEITIAVWRQTLKLYSSSGELLQTQFFEVGGDVFTIVGSGGVPALNITGPASISFDTTAPTPTPTPSPTPAPLTLDLNGTATKAVYQLYIDGQLYKEQEVSSGSTTIDIPHSAEFQGKKYLLNLKTIGYGEENSVTNKTIAEGIIEAGDTYDDVAVDAQKSNPLPVSSIDSTGNVTKSNVSVSQIEWKPGDIETTYTYTVGGNTTTVAYQGTGSESVTVYELRAASVQNMAGQEAITQAVKENTATASQGDQALVDAINANTQSTSEGLEALAGAISSPSPSPTPDPGSSPSPTPTPEPSSVEQEIEEFDTSAFSVGDGPGNIASLSNQVQWTVRMPGSNQLVDLNPMNQSWFAPLAYWIRQIIWWILTIVTIRHIYLKVRELIDEFVQAALGADITRFVRNNTSILATLAAKIPGAGPFLQVIVFFIGNGPIIAAIVLFTGFIVLHFAPAALGSTPLVGWLIGGQGFVANLAQVIVPNSPELHTSVFLLNQFIPVDHVLSCLFVFLISEVAGVFFVASAWLWWRSKI